MVVLTDLYNMRQGVKELHKPGLAIVGHTALLAKVMVVGWDELWEGHAALGRVLEQVHQLPTELGQLLVQHGTAAQPTKLCYTQLQSTWKGHPHGDSDMLNFMVSFKSNHVPVINYTWLHFVKLTWAAQLGVCMIMVKSPVRGWNESHHCSSFNHPFVQSDIWSVLTNARWCLVLCPLDFLDARRGQGDLDPWHTADEVLQGHSALQTGAQRPKLCRIAGWEATRSGYTIKHVY